MESLPIPAFYCCYLLRSANGTKLYVGSTPNMRRRLRQHNGDVQGGAKRTSEQRWKPWEVTCIVHGFPSRIAALQFEWSWQNPHISRHISADQRITQPKKTERYSPRSGKMRVKSRRPHLSLNAYMMNLHLLLRIQSFARWPLSLRFFSTDVFKVWINIDKQADGSMRDNFDIVLDPLAVDTSVKRKSAPKAIKKTQEPVVPRKGMYNAAVPDPDDVVQEPHPVSKIGKTASMIEKLDFSYSGTKAHLEKSKTLLEGNQRNACPICNIIIKNDPLVVVCPHADCSSVSHIQCLSTDFLHQEHGDGGRKMITPIEGPCPICNKTTKWRDLVQELSLRQRGQKEVEQLFKPTRKRKSDEADESDDELDVAEDEATSGFIELEEEISREMEESATASKSQKSPARKDQKSPARKDQKSPARKDQKSPARKDQKSPARKDQKSSARKKPKSPIARNKGTKTSDLNNDWEDVQVLD
ncbi:Structure-specific endonuclease subunit slx1 [Venturia nashicola]|uniref:Structure-specific endonuclease subunit slx1 n=1 Tax=Venturia nashicola TaxID=86259 RepID=A0A4Z1P1C9_9PEZI|nr:Structure-specific endonuclease subunit slx1 [Venturia nashicola]TLD18714.1 Structure-specific endonuclease subunit slx1 [Venturia nashicola]